MFSFIHTKDILRWLKKAKWNMQKQKIEKRTNEEKTNGGSSKINIIILLLLL